MRNLFQSFLYITVMSPNLLGSSSDRQLNCLFNSLFKLKRKETLMFCITVALSWLVAQLVVITTTYTTNSDDKAIKFTMFCFHGELAKLTAMYGTCVVVSFLSPGISATISPLTWVVSHFRGHHCCEVWTSSLLCSFPSIYDYAITILTRTAMIK